MAIYGHRKGTYESYKKRHDADVKAGRSKGSALSKSSWEKYHDHAQEASTHSRARRHAEEDGHSGAAHGHRSVSDHINGPGKGEEGYYAHHALKPAHTHHDVHDMMNKHDLDEDDAKELKNFKKGKEGGNKVSPAELMKMFLDKAKPETRKRMEGMSTADFMKMYAAILDDEEPGAAKAASLRERTIRLAHENPELRKHLLPLLKTANSDAYVTMNRISDDHVEVAVVGLDERNIRGRAGFLLQYVDKWAGVEIKRNIKAPLPNKDWKATGFSMSIEWDKKPYGMKSAISTLRQIARNLGLKTYVGKKSFRGWPKPPAV